MQTAETTPSSPTANAQVPKTANEVYKVIADKVRSDSMHQARLTHVEELGPLFPEMTPEEIVNYLTEMNEIEEYGDVKATMSKSGAALLYSIQHFTPEEAAERCLADETRAKMAAQVRDDSEARVRLTAVAELRQSFADIAPNQFEKYLSGFPSEPDFPDIQSVTGPTGICYLYSDKHMTSNYAALRARAETNDPTIAIAETVREESRIYPRPTKVTLFYEPVFQIEASQMKDMVERTLARPDCADIKMLVARTGAVYLYSDRYMAAGQAERWIQWEEVERFENP